MLRAEDRARGDSAVSMPGLWLFVIGLGSAIPFFSMPYFLDGSGKKTVSMFVALTVAPLAVLISPNRALPNWKFGDGIITGVAVVLSGILAYTAAAIWPNSSDEYSYLYLADTLLRGRLYNPAPPAPGLFDFAWI